MVKRFVAFGSAVLLALFLSVCSFASSSTVSLGFPFFTRLNLRRAFDSNYIYQGTAGSRPISGVAADVDGSSFATGSMFVFDFYLGGNTGLSIDHSSDFSYKVPVYSEITPFSGSTQYIQGTLNSSGGFAGSVNALYDVDYSVVTYTGSNTDAEILLLKNDTISGGDYAISGFFEFPSGTIETIDQLFTGEVGAAIFYGSEDDQIAVDVSDLRFTLSSSTCQAVQFMAVINVPESIYDISSGRVQLKLYTNPDVSAPITRFGVNTGGFEYRDTVSGIGGLSAQLANWFSGIKSQLGGIAQLLRLQQDDAQQAASEADRAAVSEASSAVQEIHQFESDLNTNITSSVSQIDFTVPSTSGFLGAMGAISVVFGSIFENLGAYQFIITIPLILGILLLLLGRGMSTLGHIQKAPDDPYQEWLKGWRK